MQDAHIVYDCYLVLWVARQPGPHPLQASTCSRYADKLGSVPEQGLWWQQIPGLGRPPSGQQLEEQQAMIWNGHPARARTTVACELRHPEAWALTSNTLSSAYKGCRHTEQQVIVQFATCTKPFSDRRLQQQRVRRGLAAAAVACKTACDILTTPSAGDSLQQQHLDLSSSIYFLQQQQ